MPRWGRLGNEKKTGTLKKHEKRRRIERHRKFYSPKEGGGQPEEKASAQRQPLNPILRTARPKKEKKQKGQEDITKKKGKTGKGRNLSL